MIRANVASIHIKMIITQGLMNTTILLILFLNIIYIKTINDDEPYLLQVFMTNGDCTLIL